jgi:RNA polymerase sigma factor (sigma-70 family)
MSDSAVDLAALYVAESGRLQRRIRRMIGCRTTAADLVHDLFLRLWDRTLVWSGDPAAYLTRCAHNAAIDFLRAERVRAEFVACAVSEQHAAPAPSPHEIVEAREDLRRIDAIIRALPERCRHVFLLARIHGRSHAEIAAALGISVSAVEKHMARALVACRAGLAGPAAPG